MSTVFAHIPHTGGRYLKRVLWLQGIEMLSYHQAASIIPAGTYYFVLREPVERAYAEYCHYSDTYKRNGIVNHLDRDVLQLDLDSIEQYFGLELNCNVMCKFLLGITRQVTEADYQQILSMPLVYDMFTDNIQYTALTALLGVDAAIFNASARYTNKLTISPEIYQQVAQYHSYDLRLYEHLRGR